MSLAEFIDSLDSLRRFSRHYMAVTESVLNHTATVAIIASYILDTLETEAPEEVSDQLARWVLTRCLVHDIDEIVTGDIARPTKYAKPELTVLIKQLESEAIETVIDKFKLPKGWHVAWQNSKDGTLAGHIVEVADFCSVLITVQREINLHGNTAFTRLLPEVMDKGDEMRQWLLNCRGKAYRLMRALVTDLMDGIRS